MKILFGTGNSAKLSRMRKHLRQLKEIQIVGLKDMPGEIPAAPENGSTPLENARQKAWAYYRHYNIPVFSCDSGLYFENLPESLQPGVHVRNVGGKCLTDEEMLQYYSGLAREYGDLTARYYNAICFILDESHVYESMDEAFASEKFIITAKPHQLIRKGFPLDSLSKDIHTGRYYYDIQNGEADKLAGYPVYEDFFRKHLGLREIEIKKTIGLTKDAGQIREEVFVKEQGFQEEFDDETDKKASHLVFYKEGKAVAVCRYYGKGSGEYILGRIAVRKPYRGKGIGILVVRAAEEEMQKEGAGKIVLSAQVRVQGFYEKCGYAAAGKPYLDENCLHIRMEKEMPQERCIAGKIDKNIPC